MHQSVTRQGADHADEVAECFAILRITRQEDEYLGIGAPLLQLGRQRIGIRRLEPIGLVFVVQRLHNRAQRSDHVHVVDPGFPQLPAHVHIMMDSDGRRGSDIAGSRRPMSADRGIASGPAAPEP